VFFKNVGKH